MYELYEEDPHEWISLGYKPSLLEADEDMLVVVCTRCNTYSYRLYEEQTDSYEEIFREESSDEDPCD